MVPRSNIAVYRRIRQALNVVSRVSKDGSFMEFYEPNMAILRRSLEPVFLEVELKDESPEAELYLDNCWVTGSLDFNSTPKWTITVDGQVVIE
nr:zona pellucida sperm-binding protein 2-like [Dromaius novaehollandiae]